jgi:pimeloyl-ACP methyl ester carboxylesterase
MPALFITAVHDYTSVQDKKRYVDQIPNARMVVVENSRHGTPLDQPVVFRMCCISCPARRSEL